MNDVPNASLGYGRENEVRILFAPTSATKVAVANNNLVLAKPLDSPPSRYQELQRSLRRLPFEVLSNRLLD
jgi:hypothetical protein